MDKYLKAIEKYSLCYNILTTVYEKASDNLKKEFIEAREVLSFYDKNKKSYDDMYEYASFMYERVEMDGTLTKFREEIEGQCKRMETLIFDINIRSQ